MKINKRKCFKCGRVSSKDSIIPLYRFPKPGITNLQKCAKWAKFILPDQPWNSENIQQKLYSQHRMLCDLHFEANCFINVAEKRLIRDAVPTIEVLEKGPMEMDIDINVLRDVTNHPLLSTSSNTPILSVPSTSGNTPTTSQNIHGKVLKPQMDINKKKKLAICKKYVNKIWRLKNTLKKLQTGEMLKLDHNASFQKLAKMLTPSFAAIMQGQLRNFKKKLKGRRWTQEEKIIALRLYKRSPTCYRLLGRLFTLPSPSTLKTLLSKFKLKVGINARLFELLKRYAKSLAKEENHFVIMFDEMSIKKNLLYNKHEDQIEGFQDHDNHGRTPEEASHALVFMLGGIRMAVKQPIAFYLSGSHVTADRLSVIIKEVVQACFNVGINIQSLVCDMDGVNYRAYKLLGATEAQPVIKINDNRVITMFDTPHLLKCFRNLFLKYDIKCPVDLNTQEPTMGTAKWSHLKQFYELERNSGTFFVHAPGLSNIHLEPNTKQKMRVNLAAQVLSHTVASGMFAVIGTGALTTEAVVTASVISNMDKLFDLVNSSTSDLRRCKPFATNLSNRSPHLEFFKKMIHFFKNIVFIGCKRDPPSRIGWIWTLAALERVWANMRCREIRSLETRRFQQDPLENYFSLIRTNYCGTNTNPTVGQFRAALKTSLLSKLPVISSGNCKNDDNTIILDNFKKLLTHSNPEAIEEASEIEIEVGEVNSIDDAQACAYVCGFVIRKLGSSCVTCNSILNATEQEDIHTFVSFREYTDKRQSLRYAARPLVECVEQSAKIIVDFLDKYSHKNNLKKQIQSLLMRHVAFDFLKECSEHFDHVRLFIIDSVFYVVIKRFCILKNRQYAEDAHKIALKKKIDILKHA